MMVTNEALHVNWPLIFCVVQTNFVGVHGSTIIKKPSESKLEEAVESFPIIEEFVVRLVGIRTSRIAEFIRIDRIKVGSVRWEFNSRDVRSHLASETFVEVHLPEEGVALHLLGILAEAILRAGAQIEDQICAVARQVCRLGDVKTSFPIDDLESY